jgi:hypothetical protein
MPEHVIYVSPDGRRVLLAGVTRSVFDEWLLENFEPKAPATR